MLGDMLRLQNLITAPWRAFSAWCERVDAIPPIIGDDDHEDYDRFDEGY